MIVEESLRVLGLEFMRVSVRLSKGVCMRWDRCGVGWCTLGGMCVWEYVE